MAHAPALRFTYLDSVSSSWTAIRFLTAAKGARHLPENPLHRSATLLNCCADTLTDDDPIPIDGES